MNRASRTWLATNLWQDSRVQFRAYLHWVGTAPPMAGLLRLVYAIPPSEPDVRLSPHPALHQMG